MVTECTNTISILRLLDVFKTRIKRGVSCEIDVQRIGSNFDSILQGFNGCSRKTAVRLAIPSASTLRLWKSPGSSIRWCLILHISSCPHVKILTVWPCWWCVHWWPSYKDNQNLAIWRKGNAPGNLSRPTSLPLHFICGYGCSVHPFPSDIIRMPTIWLQR